MYTRTQGALAAYLSETFVGDDPFAEIRAAGEVLRPGMQVSPYEAYLLRWIVRISGATRILELGCFMGYSARTMADGMPESGTLITLERSAEYATMAVQHCAPDARITVAQGDALSWVRAYDGPPFDLLFLDAEKREYPDYLEAAWPHLTHNAWILADNSLLWGAVTGEDPKAASAEATDAMRRFNAMLADRTRFDGVLLTTPEGLTVARRR
jgi:predicted O-methyltransferase YrrM